MPEGEVKRMSTQHHRDLLDAACRLGLGWAAFRMPVLDPDDSVFPEGQEVSALPMLPNPITHLVGLEASAHRTWQSSDRKGFVVAPFDAREAEPAWIGADLLWKETDRVEDLEGQMRALQNSGEINDDAKAVLKSLSELWKQPLTSEFQHLDHNDERPQSQSEYCRNIEGLLDNLHLPESEPKEFSDHEYLLKVVWSRVIPVPLLETAHPYLLFEELCRRYPSLHVVLCHHPRWGIWLGASPEILMAKEGPEVISMALAGTRALSSPDESMPWGNKEKREQGMVLQFLHDQFLKLGMEPRSGKTHTLRTGPVEHLLTTLRGSTSLDCYPVARALHPTPAIAGYPVREALPLLLEREGHRRKLYGGYWGYLNEEGDGRLSVNLRCLQWQPGRASLYVGAGILADSHPPSEWLETEHKAATLLNVLKDLQWIAS